MEVPEPNINYYDSDEIVGVINFHRDFYSEILSNERDIIVWLPPSYLNSQKRFPVLYMNDGQNLFFPHLSYIGYDWKVDETASQLISEGRIEEIIIVGINNSIDRLDEYNWFTEKGQKYASFIIDELKPFIDETYNTLPEKDNTAIMGSSMGGLNSFQLVWNYPEVFGKAGCMSNSFWVNNQQIFMMVKNNHHKIKDVKLYLDCGELETSLISDNIKMCKYLKKIGYKKGNNLLCHFEEGAVHSEVDWAKRLHIPLTFLFGINNE
ncbi:MAG: alpha/beta hydrolase-fold protein [bacterium]